MTKPRINSAPAKPPAYPRERGGGLVRAWARFWFSPVDPIGLHWLRVLAGIFFLTALLPFAGYEADLLGLEGWFDQRALTETARLPPEQGPGIAPWSIYYFSNPSLLAAIYWLSIGVIALFTLGIWARLTSILTWVALASFTANPAIAYDGDFLLTMPAFYLMVGYVLLGQGKKDQSLFSRLLGPSDIWLLRKRSDASESEPSVGANIALRLIQVHFAVAILANGLQKLQFGDWWAGVALWYPLYPPFVTTLDELLAHRADAELYVGVLSLAAYAVLAWQIAFPFFAWRRSWRIILLGGAVVGWLGQVFVYRLPLFGPGIFICCLSYLTAAEWQRLGAWLAHVPGLGWLARTAAQGEDERAGRKAEAVAS